MGKFYLLVLVVIAIILGVVTLLTQNKSNSSNPDLALQNPTTKPTNILEIPSQQPTGATQPTKTSDVIPQTLWVTNASSAAIKTVKGEIDIQFYPQDAPKTVTN